MPAPFLETPRFPDDLSFWAKGGVSYSTVVSGSTSGRETRNSLWQYGRGQWTLQNAGRTNVPADNYNVQALRNFFRVVKGQAYGFRFRDWTDYTAEGNGVLGAPVKALTTPYAPTGTGLGLPVYQLFKKYVLAPLADYRMVQKPRSGTIAVLKNGVAWAGTLDYATGLFTPTDTPTTGLVTSTTTGSATVLHCGTVPPGLVVGDYVYVRAVGATGTLGAHLSDASWQVTGISGGDVTIAAVTTGLTGAVPNLYRYSVQPADAITWTGEFDTPVRFDTDQFDASFDPQGLYVISLNLIEVRLEP